MDQILRLILAPYHFFFSQEGRIGAMWNESSQSRALLLGLPSILIAVLGVGTLCLSQMVVAKSLEERYRSEVEKSSEEKQELVDELRLEARMLASKQAETGSTDIKKLASEYIDSDDPRREQLKVCQSKEQVYLEKLIDLNPQVPDYRFELAMLSFEKRDVPRCLALLRQIAPLDEPGHVKSHLWLANWYTRARVKTKSELQNNVNKALAHANQCLKRDQNNLPAKQMKARLLYSINKLSDAYNLFFELFSDNPRFYKPLVEINNRLNRSEDNQDVLNQAIIRLDLMLKDKSLEERQRAMLWDDLSNCFREKKDFETIKDRLEIELQRSAQSPETSMRRIWIERLLSQVYLSWIGHESDIGIENNLERRLEMLKRAYQYNPTSEIVLREFVRLGNDENEAIANQARAVYSAERDFDAPSLVLNELGAQLLRRSQYEQAIEKFKDAQKKSPRNPEILNNLAYAYLVSRNPQPARSLKLIDEATRYLPNTDLGREYQTHFRDTRARALMQLGKFPEAIHEFELALKDRPDAITILESLVQCYKSASMLKESEIYARRIEEVKAAAASEDQ
jgi:tetratricopeptide (TPR) repeat protein